jgi:hypothetical protein
VHGVARWSATLVAIRPTFANFGEYMIESKFSDFDFFMLDGFTKSSRRLPYNTIDMFKSKTDRAVIEVVLIKTVCMRRNLPH